MLAKLSELSEPNLDLNIGHDPVDGKGAGVTGSQCKLLPTYFIGPEHWQEATRAQYGRMY